MVADKRDAAQLPHSMSAQDKVRMGSISHIRP